MYLQANGEVLFAGAVLPIFSVLADVVLYRGAKSSNTEKDALKVVRTKITGTGEHLHKLYPTWSFYVSSWPFWHLTIQTLHTESHSMLLYAT